MPDDRFYATNEDLRIRFGSKPLRLSQRDEIAAIEKTIACMKEAQSNSDDRDYYNDMLNELAWRIEIIEG